MLYRTLKKSGRKPGLFKNKDVISTFTGHLLMATRSGLQKIQTTPRNQEKETENTLLIFPTIYLPFYNW